MVVDVSQNVVGLAPLYPPYTRVRHAGRRTLYCRHHSQNNRPKGCIIVKLLAELQRWWRRRDRVGPRGERIAARHLRRQGYRIVGRNVQLAGGEIDLLATTADGRTLVVVEVKANADATAAMIPELRVGFEKQRRLRRLGVQALRRHGRGQRMAVRFDVVGVALRGRWRRAIVRHHRAAFEMA